MRIKTYRVLRNWIIVIIFMLVQYIIYNVCHSIEINGSINTVALSILMMLFDIPLSLYFIFIIKASKEANRIMFNKEWKNQNTKIAGMYYARIIEKDINSTISKMILVISILNILINAILCVINITSILDGIYVIIYYLFAAISNAILIGSIFNCIDIDLKESINKAYRG